uniref:DDE Tnp4 domain-containing protein n=2 Tax=Aegilops tauschii subsp. strangulata TaxID=200361 RepID=A0A453QZN7_AEGTS
YLDRNREAGNELLVADYFSANPVYTDAQFRRRYRMRKPLFHRIVQALEDWSPEFRHRRDALNRSGFTPLQKCTTVMRMLAYGCSADFIDDHLRIGNSTALKCLQKFVEGINEIFGPQYLRQPTPEDIDRILQINEARGFPGMLGSLDCMHWEWKNYPTAWKGQFTRGDHGVSTMMLEAVASQDLWIWHAFFGVAGSNNDLNVLNQSTLFTNVLQGRAPAVQFTVCGSEYNMGYYLVDGIYPEWAAFVKTIPLPQNERDKCFARRQEGARKDVERAFGVLQARFAILRIPARFWKRSLLSKIMYACIIIHNMIVEDERDTYRVRYDFNLYDQGCNPIPPVQPEHGPIDGFTDLLDRNAALRDRRRHIRLKKDLVEHIWRRFGDGQGNN